MIRTNAVDLTTLKGVAYREKFPSGGSGVVIIREDGGQPGIAAISKTSGDPIPAANNPKDVYPLEAFREAIALTAGLPYKRQGVVRLKGKSRHEEKPVEEQPAEETVVDSADYERIVEKYTDKTGRLSYALLNRDLIRFIHSSSIARRMVSEGESEDAVRLYAVGSKFRSITGNHDLSDEQVLKILALLDEVSPKGVLKEFNEELRKNRAGRK